MNQNQTYYLAADTGNTNSVFGLFSDHTEDILWHWRTVTQKNRTSDELGIYLMGFLQSKGISSADIKGVMYSSVVPTFNPILERMVQDYLHCPVHKVTYERGLTFRIDYPRPWEIGADRLVNAEAVFQKHGGNAVIIDLGTATTFCYMKDGSYMGGAIAPGLKLSMEALHRNTAQLPPIEFIRPESGILGKSTVAALQSGFYYGWVGLLKEVINQFRKEHGNGEIKVIATGGLASLIHKEDTSLFDIVDPLLTLKGLRYIYYNLTRY